MNTDFITYQRFRSREDLMVTIGVLKANEIDFLIEDDSILFNPSFVEAWDDKQWVLKVKYEDIEYIKTTLQQWAKLQVQSVSTEHPFFEFNELELLEVVQNPSQWPLLEVHLAESILKRRGVLLDANAKLEWNKIKIPQEAQEWSKITWVLAVFFTLVGGFIGAYMGWMLYSSKQSASVDSSEFVFIERDRKYALGLVWLGILSFSVYLYYALICCL